jgi:hypothetical protein
MKLNHRLLLIVILFSLILSLLSACATVKPYEREMLSDPTMDFQARREEVAMEQHFLLTREGSIGGLGGAGGGCACN